MDNERRKGSVRVQFEPPVKVTVMAIDGLDDLLARRQDGLYIFVQDELKFLDGVEVRRIGHDDAEDSAVLGHGNDDVFARDRFGNEFDHGRRDFNFLEFNKSEAVLLGLRLHNVVGVRISQFYQRVLDGGETIQLDLVDGQKSAVFRSGEDYLYLVVPLV